MGGRGQSRMGASGGMSANDRALKEFLTQGAARYAAGKSAKNKVLAAEANAMAGIVGTKRLDAMLSSDGYKGARSALKDSSLDSSKVDSMLKGKQRPMGLSDASFSALQSSLRSLKSSGYSNEEIAGAIRWGRHVRS